MNYSLITFIIGALILILCWDSTLKTPRPNWWELPRVEESHLRESYQSRQMAELIRSYTTGQTRRLPRQVKKLHNDLGLMHLLTPSGLHLSVIWQFFFPWVSFFFVRPKWFIKPILSGLCTLVLWQCEGLMAMQRMALFRSISAIIPSFNFKLGICFVATFGLSFLFGNFHQSPLSFALSFLFFGQILCANGSALRLCAGILASQALVQSLFLQAYSPLGALFGVFITPLFVLIFPLMLFDYWVWGRFISLINFEWLFNLYYSFCTYLHGISSITPYSLIDPSLSFAIAFIGLTKSKFLRYAGVALLLISTKPLLNLPAHAHLKEVQTPRETRHRLYFAPKNIERTPRGYKTWTSKEVCYHRLLISQYSRECRRK